MRAEHAHLLVSPEKVEAAIPRGRGRNFKWEISSEHGTDSVAVRCAIEDVTESTALLLRLRTTHGSV